MWPAVNYEEWRRPATRCTPIPRSWASWRWARATGARAPARGVAADRARLGDVPLPAPDGSESMVVTLDLQPTRRSSSTARAGRRASAGPGQAGRRRDPGTAGRGRSDWRARSRSTHAAGGPVERAAGRGRGARALRSRPGGDLLRGGYPGGRCWPRSGRRTAAVTPVNAWWGSFDLAVSLFSGLPADAAVETSSCATRWTHRRSRSAGGRVIPATTGPRSTPTRTRRRPDFDEATLSPAGGRWDAGAGEYVLDWDDVRAAADPHAAALEFARSAFRHACVVCGWDPRSRPAPTEPRRRSSSLRRPRRTPPRQPHGLLVRTSSSCWSTAQRSPKGR